MQHTHTHTHTYIYMLQIQIYAVIESGANYCKWASIKQLLYKLAGLS